MNLITLPSGKRVLVSDSYWPGRGARADFVGRVQEMRLITAAWIGDGAQRPLCPLLLGEPGVGKNRLVYELAHRTGLDLYILQGHEDVTAEDLACAVRFSDEPGRTMDYVISPLVTAMHRGGICFIDEIGKIRPRALALLASVLDERRYIDSTLLGERVQAHPRFRFIAATNTGERSALPEFIRSRLRPVIEVGYPPREEINLIIARQTAREPHLDELLRVFWDLFADSQRPPSPRDAVHLFALAASLRDYAQSEGKTGSKRNGSSRRFLPESPETPFPVTPAHLTEAFQQLFPPEQR